MASHSRILLVDDEEAITANLAPVLEGAGFTVEVASDGEEALRRVADSAPNLVVLDVLMPGLDGHEVCGRLRAAGARGIAAHRHPPGPRVSPEGVKDAFSTTSTTRLIAVSGFRLALRYEYQRVMEEKWWEQLRGERG